MARNFGRQAAESLDHENEQNGLRPGQIASDERTHGRNHEGFPDGLDEIIRQKQKKDVEG